MAADVIIEQAITTCYEKSIIDDFIQNYKQYRCNPINIVQSPSDIIVHSVLAYS